MRWGVAVALVALTTALSLVLQPWVSGDGGYLLFLPAILVSAWYGGFRPGVLATGLSALALMFWLLPPDGFVVDGVADLVSIALFTGLGIALSWINHLLKHAKEAHRDAVALATGRDEQLRASEARWRAVIESAVDGIIVIDEHGRVEAFNPAAERLFGYTEAEVLGRNVDMLMPSPYREEHDSYLSRYLATGRAKVIGIGREVTGMRRDETTFPLHLSVGQVVIEGQPKFTGILHDLSGRVRMEEQLREQTSLARLGEMAAVLAHEVKNPLAGIRGAMQVMSTRMAAGSTDAAMTGEIIARIDALDALMKDLLLFARPPKPRLRSIEPTPLVAVTVGLLKEDAALRDVDVEIEGSSPPVSADPEMLKMVFHNLLVNGAQAMNGRGRIRVDIAPVNGACQIVFADSGPGIAVEARGKVFTPFFTTKSRGTGLGLPTAKRFIEAHQGTISVDCPPTGGTAVTIRLPLVLAST